MINFLSNQKNTFLAITAMVVGVIFIDIHGLIVKFLGGEYSTIQLALFRNTFAIIPLILLLVYKKPETTKKVIDAIRLSNVKKIYISINIPPKKNIEDLEKYRLSPKKYYYDYKNLERIYSFGEKISKKILNTAKGGAY